MRGDERFPGDQAEIVFHEAFVDYLLDLTERERIQVLTDVTTLCEVPVGTHPLSNRNKNDRLAGLNTLYTLGREHRIVFASRVVEGVGTVEVLCAGPRRGSAVYDVANLLVTTGHLTEAEVTQLWETIELVEHTAEELGLDGWDYAPPAAEPYLVDLVVRTGAFDLETARTLSRDEANAALVASYEHDGDVATIRAAVLSKARSRAGYDDAGAVFRRRLEPRCLAWMPKAKKRCLRRDGHPGPHRSSPPLGGTY